MRRNARQDLRAWVGVMIALLGAGACFADLSEPGPFKHGQATVVVERPDGSTFESLLYYPATADGDNTPLDPSGAPYAAISFGHGYFTSPTRYDTTLEHLATWGYFVMATKSGLELFPDHAEYADDLSHCLTYLEDQNGDSGSWLFQQVDTTAFGMSGHSMGGGASILATAEDPRVKALSNLAAAETDPSAIDAMPAVVVPVSLISGTDDTIVPYPSNGLAMYNNTASVRQLPVIDGAYHCGFLDSSIIFCDDGDMSREDQLKYTRRLLTEFFNLYLKGDNSIWQTVWGPEAFADPLIDRTVDPRCALASETESLSVQAGRVSETTLTLTHSLGVDASYTYVAEGEGPAAEVTPPNSGPLSPGSSSDVTVGVQPLQTDSFSSVPWLFSARSDLDGGTRSYQQIQITIYAADDLNRDAVVNLLDYQSFRNCVGGPEIPRDPGCELSDLDFDGDVDLLDFGLFQQLFTLTVD